MPTYPTYKLGEICETTSGGTPNRKNDAYYGGIIPWVKSGELGKGVIYDTEEKITEKAVKESSAKVFPEGTLLIALYGATIGKLGFLGVPAATNQAVCGIFANEKIDLQFLSYYLFHKRNDLIAQGTGGAQPNISQTILKNLPIPLPPLPTQQAIVARIETLFAELDKAVQHLRTAQQQLKTYRQAVLNHWLNNDDGKWETVKLGEVVDVRDGTHDTPKYVQTGIPFVTQKNITEAGISFTNVQYITEQDHLKFHERSNVARNDILIAMIGANRGNATIVNTDVVFSIKNVGLLKYTPDKFNNRFLLYYLRSQTAVNYIKKESKGGAQEFIGLKELRSFPVFCPSLTEQQRIVKEIESRLSQATASETYIENALQQAEALRQSILKKAFSGELVVSTGSTTANCG